MMKSEDGSVAMQNCSALTKTSKRPFRTVECTAKMTMEEIL